MPEYGLIAPYYDFLLQPVLKNIRRELLNIILEFQPEKVLDVACGTGVQLRVLSENHINAVGIDLSEAMLRQCRQLNPAADCLLQDGRAMAFRSASFDLVMTSFALHECGWSVANTMLDEIYRVLKPGGHLLVVDYTDLKQTRALVRLAISTIEFLAGRRHYRNFRTYLHHGGLPALIDSDRFSLQASHQRASGAIALGQFERLDFR